MRKVWLFSLLSLFACSAEADYILNPADRLRFGVGGYVRGYTGKMESYQYNSVLKTEPRLTMAYDVTDDLRFKGKIAYRLIRNDRFVEDKKSRVYDAYVTFDSKAYGVLDIGKLRNVAYLMHKGPVDVSSLDVDDSDIHFFYRKPKGFYAPIMTYLNADSRDPKISYTTPSFKGVKGGVSVVQSEDVDYETCAPLGIKTDHGKGVIAAVQYQKEIASFQVASSAGYAYYHNDRFKLDTGNIDANHNEYSLGLNIAKNNYSIGASYRRILFQDKLDIHDSKAFTVGAAYDGEVYGASLVWLHSEATSLEKNEYNHIMLSGKYQVTPYAKLFASVGRIDFLQETARDQKRYFGITGIEFSL